MLEGVWMIVWTAKIFPKQNGGRLFEIVDSAPFDATQGLLPCYNRDLSTVIRNLCCQSARGNRSGAVRYFLTAPDRFPRADWQHKFLVTGLNPLSSHWPLQMIAACFLYIRQRNGSPLIQDQDVTPVLIQAVAWVICCSLSNQYLDKILWNFNDGPKHFH